MRKTLIITGANTAREINRYDPRPYDPEYPPGQIFHTPDFLLWKKEEDSLKEYVIKKTPLCDFFERIEKLFVGKISHVNHGYVIGRVVECEVNEETLEAIIL